MSKREKRQISEKEIKEQELSKYQNICIFAELFESIAKQILSQKGRLSLTEKGSPNGSGKNYIII